MKGLNVYSGSLYELINESTVFISRFSTAIIEALLIGCPVIYYNPHNEKQVPYIDPMGGFPTPKNKIELKDALIEVLSNREKWLNRAEKFLDFHVANRDGSSTKIFAKELIKIANNKGKTTSYLPVRSNLKYMFEFFTRQFKW